MNHMTKSEVFLWTLSILAALTLIGGIIVAFVITGTANAERESSLKVLCVQQGGIWDGPGNRCVWSKAVQAK